MEHLSVEERAIVVSASYMIYANVRSEQDRFEFTIPTASLYLEARKKLGITGDLSIDTDTLRDAIVENLRTMFGKTAVISTTEISGIIKVKLYAPEQFPEGTRLMCPACGLVSNDHVFKGTHHVCPDCETSSLEEQFIDEDSCEQKKEIDVLEEELEALETRTLEIKTLLSNLYDDKYELWQVDYDVRS